MSVEDVCELGSILQSGDKEKQILERKLIELDGAIQTQDRRVSDILQVHAHLTEHIIWINSFPNQIETA